MFSEIWTLRGRKAEVAPTCTQYEKYPSVVAIKTIPDVATG